jgi:hypothetical protein
VLRVTKVSIEGTGKVLEILGGAAISPNQENVPATGRPTMPSISSLRLTISIRNAGTLYAERLFGGTTGQAREHQATPLDARNRRGQCSLRSCRGWDMATQHEHPGMQSAML